MDTIPLNVFIVGPQCGGKSTISTHLGNIMGVMPLFIGRRLRNKYSIKDFITGTDLVSAPEEMDEEVFNMVVDFLKSCPGTFRIVDSFPRNVRQRKWLVEYHRDYPEEHYLILYVYAPFFVRGIRYFRKTTISIDTLIYFIKREWQDRKELRKVFDLLSSFKIPILKINTYH